VARAGGPGEAVVTATLNIEALRYRRSQVMLNVLAQLRTGVFAPIYESVAAGPMDRFLERPMRESREAAALTRETIRRFVEQGIYAEGEFERRLAAEEAEGATR
jgi:hypothetical protein